MRKVIIITLLLLTTFSSSLKSQERIENLFDELKAAHHDTTRANTLLKIAQFYANDNPDSSFYWLSRIDLLEQNNSLTTAAIDYYKGLAHIEKAKVYILHNRHLNLALQQNDSAIKIFDPLLENKPKKYLANKILQGLATAYSLNGKVYLLTGSLNSSINSYESALNVLDSLDHKVGVAKMNNNLGVLNRRISNHPKAIEHFQAALNYFQSNNDTVAIASILTNMGAVSHDIGAYEKSLESYFSALSILEEFNEKESVALTLVNIGGVLVDSKNVLESISYYNRALTIFEELKDERGKATTLLSKGIAYKEAEILDSSSVFLVQAEKLFKQNNDKMGQADALYEIGQVLLKQKKYSDARYNLSLALELAQQSNFQSVISGVQYHLAIIAYELGNFEQAKLYALKAVDSSTKNNMLSLQKDAHGLLSSIYEDMSEVGLSLMHHKLYFALNDSLYTLHRANKFAEMEAVYRLEQKELEIEKLQRENELKDVLLHNAELKILWQRAHTYIILGIMLFLTIIMYLLFRQYRLNRKSNSQLRQHNTEILQKNEEITAQKEEIEAQRNEVERQREVLREKSEQLERFNWLITDSIDYASSIQQALLPAKEIFEHYFTEHFIMYFPKDVVSGDFYWAYPKNNTITIALGDCTGHGVPGGFMSMLGISALTELMGRQIEHPSDILDNLRLFIIESLKQEGTIGEHQEGMDISLIRYTKGDDFVEFAGANQPLWIVKFGDDGICSLTEQKGDRMPISYHQRMRPFSSFRISVKKGDILYLFTDGYRHQLGGENFNQKFGKSRFIDILTQNAQKPLDDQQSIIEDAFFRWVDGNDQLDDITVIGLKI